MVWRITKNLLISTVIYLSVVCPSFTSGLANADTESISPLGAEQVKALNQGELFVDEIFENTVGISSLKQFDDSQLLSPKGDCHKFFESLRNKDKPYRNYFGAKPFSVSHVASGLEFKGKIFVDVGNIVCNMSDLPSERSSIWFEAEVSSFIGPLITWKLNLNGRYREGSGTDYLTGWYAWNLAEGRTAELDDFFETNSVLKALKMDKVIRQRFYQIKSKHDAPAKALESESSIKSILAKMMLDPRQKDALDEGANFSFRIYDFDTKTGLASVRLNFYGDCCHSGKIFEIGLQLLPKSEYKEYFVLAKAGKGFKLGKNIKNPIFI